MPSITAGAIIGSAVLGAGTSMLGSSQAAGASKDAANMQKMQYLMTRGDLAPFTAAGQSVTPNLLALATGSPTGGGPDFVNLAYQNLPGQMTQQQLEATPGYQFTLAQGLKSVQSANAAKGLGVSGAALKGAAQYATGLADSTYANRFNEAQQRFNDFINLNTGQQGNITNQYNRLADVAKIGANAAAGLGQIGASSASTAGNYINQAGLAQAAGTKGIGNAVTSGVNSYLGYNALQDYLGGGGGTKGYVDTGAFDA